MGYMTIKEESENRLHFTRQPGINSWGMLMGFSAVGIGISYYGNDHIFMKLIYIVLAVMAGLCCLDDWEECDFNKETEEVRVKRVSIWDILTNKQEDVIVIAINQVMESSVTTEKVSFFGNTYRVVLRLSEGASVGITESFTFGSSSEHHATSDKIHHFLKLDDRVVDNDFIDSSSSEDDDAAEDFERIDKSELLNECDESGSPVNTAEQESDESCVKSEDS